MAKRRNVSGRVLRNAVPQPRDVAEFVAPRTVNEGLSIKNVFGDVGDMIDPFITAAIEKQEGLRDVSDDELKMLAALGSIPVAGAVASKVTKKLNKLVPNPKGGFANAVFLRKSKKPILVKPETMSGYEKFCAAIDEGVKKGEISPADGMRFKQNAFANIQNEAKIKSMAEAGKYDLNRSDQFANRIYREDIPESSREYFDFASSVGENAGKQLNQYPVGVNRTGQKIYSKGDQGNLLWNEHVMDANTSRHALSDYDKKQDEVNQILKKAYPAPDSRANIAAGIKTYNGYKNVYKTVAEPSMADAAEKKLGFNYKEAADKSFNEGTRMTKENPKYMTVKDFYKFMFDLD